MWIMMLIAPTGIAAILNLLVWIMVVALICWLLWWLIGYMGLPEPFDKVLRVIVGFLAVLFLINAILSLVGQSFIRW